jgi:hypothetical protein
MMDYLKETYVDTSTLSRIGVKRDLDACAMRKEENPKILFDKLVAVQYRAVCRQNCDVGCAQEGSE